MEKLSKDYTLTLLVENKIILQYCIKVGKHISNKYRDKEIVILGIMKGAFVFLSEVLKNINKYDIHIEFLSASSFRGDFERQNLVITDNQDLSIVEGKTVIIIDDIIDSGITVCRIQDKLYSLGAKEVNIITLLEKETPNFAPIILDFPAIKIPDVFVVGFGLDIENKYRNLKDIYYLVKKEKRI